MSFSPFLPRSRRPVTGFSLMELVMQIAIISYLATILFPALASAREMARLSICQGNLKQIALGIQQYVQDYDGTYPANSHAVYAGTNFLGKAGWTQTLSPYTKSLTILQCPTETQEQNPYLKDVSYTPYPLQWYGHSDYFYNLNFSHPNQTPGSPGEKVGVNEARVSSPALTVMLGDSHTGESDESSISPDTYRSVRLTYKNDGSWDPSTPNVAEGPMAMLRHGEGANYAFADGHVKWLKYTAISPGYAGYSAQGFSTPYPGTYYNNALPPGQLAAPYTATFAPWD